MSASLKTLIDTPDLEASLLADTDGTFHENVVAYLDSCKQSIRQTLDAGLPRHEFESLSRLLESIETTERVINFFVKMKPVTTGLS